MIFCSGKVYYDLHSARQKEEIDDVAIFRMEQFYPFARDAMTEIRTRYGATKDVVWAQEEPRNMGGWDFVDERILELLGEQQALRYVGRPPAASPATGSLARHRAETVQLIEQVLKG